VKINDHARKIVDMACLPALDRLKKFLPEVVCELGEAPIPLIRQWEIAELLGITPEHLSRLLKILELKGLIQRNGSCFLVSDIKGLKSFLADSSQCSETSY